MDIVGPLPRAPGSNKFVLLATGYFTKWVEAESYVSVTQDDVFDNRRFRSYCIEKGIKLQFSSRSYPQGNGQAEKTNRTTFYCLKKKLEQRKGKWHDELPNILWAYRTTKRKPTGESPFSLAYGTEAVIPTEVGLPTVRTLVVENGENDQQLAHNFDLVEEQRKIVTLRLANYQNQVAAYFNKRVKSKRFRVGEWVLRKVMENTKDLNAGKLGRIWERPYEVTKAFGNRAYKLRHVETVAFHPNLKIRSKAEEYKLRDEDRIKIEN
ncbi:hypothetical protein COP2_019024 [Malus domestica]